MRIHPRVIVPVRLGNPTVDKLVSLFFWLAVLGLALALLIAYA